MSRCLAIGSYLSSLYVAERASRAAHRAGFRRNLRSTLDALGSEVQLGSTSQQNNPEHLAGGDDKNQLARFANTEGVFPAEAESIITEYRAIVPRLSAAIETLADS